MKVLCAILLALSIVGLAVMVVSAVRLDTAVVIRDVVSAVKPDICTTNSGVLVGDTMTHHSSNPFAENYPKRRVVLEVKDGWVKYIVEWPDGTWFECSMDVDRWNLLKELNKESAK